MITVTPEAVTSMRALAQEITQLHQQLQNDANSLIIVFEENRGELGAHSAKIAALMEALGDVTRNIAPVKKLVRRLKLSADIRQAHITGTIPAVAVQPSAPTGEDVQLAGVLGGIYEAGYQKLRLPQNNGHWDSDTFHPDPDHLPEKFNPRNLTFGQITRDLESRFGIRYTGTPFLKHQADFSGIALAQISMFDILEASEEAGFEYDPDSHFDMHTAFETRQRNFRLADIITAQSQIPIPGLAPGYSWEDLAKWREENHFTWDESRLNGYLLVPAEIHNNIPHTGLVSMESHAAQARQNLED